MIRLYGEIEIDDQAWDWEIKADNFSDGKDMLLEEFEDVLDELGYEYEIETVDHNLCEIKIFDSMIRIGSGIIEEV